MALTFAERIQLKRAAQQVGEDYDDDREASISEAQAHGYYWHDRTAQDTQLELVLLSEPSARRPDAAASRTGSPGHRRGRGAPDGRG